ncbi:hypothetical protein AMTRI_Chr13g122190 [Amborella trichopoda]
MENNKLMLNLVDCGSIRPDAFGVPKSEISTDLSRKRKAEFTGQHAKSFKGLSESDRNNLREEVMYLLLNDDKMSQAVSAYLGETLQGTAGTEFAKRNLEGTQQPDRRQFSQDLAYKIEACLFSSYGGASDVYIQKAQALILTLKDNTSSGVTNSNLPGDLCVGVSSPQTASFSERGDVSAFDQQHESAERSKTISLNGFSTNATCHLMRKMDPKQSAVPLRMTTSVSSSCTGSSHSEDGKPKNGVSSSGNPIKENTPATQHGSNVGEVAVEHSESLGVQKSNGRKDGNDLKRHFLNLDTERNSNMGTVNPSFDDKLWEGHLQLNSSHKMEAVAYRKSDVKPPKISWSKCIEVKGKVRLEAFEKFIQELPRSRNRALMIAKGYKEGQKIGVAELAPGVDIYVCPQSHTIITLLSKHGFYKGAAANLDDQDALIGCVVWRRNRATSSSLPKASETYVSPLSRQSSDSPSISSTPHSVETKAPPTNNLEGNQGTKQVTINNPTPDARTQYIEPIGIAIQNADADNKKVQQATLLCKNITHKQTVHQLSPVTVEGLSTSVPKDPRTNFFKVEKPNVPKERSKFDGATKVSKDSLSELFHALIRNPQKFGSPDDEDLPEFDFVSACGLPQFPLNVPPLISNEAKKQPQVAETSDPKCPLFSALRISRQLAVAHQQNLHPPIPLLQVEVNSHQESKKNGEHEMKVLVSISPTTKTTQSLCSKEEITGPTNVNCNMILPSPKVASQVVQKPLWDDDDDMPEWCPPSVDHKPETGPSASAASRPSFFFTPANITLGHFQAPQGPPYPQPQVHQPNFPQGHQPRPMDIHDQGNPPLLPTPIWPPSCNFARTPVMALNSNARPSLMPTSDIFDLRPFGGPMGERGQRF